MGGGRWFYFPTHIWTPAGGWYPSPKNWRANTLVMLGAIGVAAFSTFTLSASLEVRGSLCWLALCGWGAGIRTWMRCEWRGGRPWLVEYGVRWSDGGWRPPDRDTTHPACLACARAWVSIVPTKNKSIHPFNSSTNPFFFPISPSQRRPIAPAWPIPSQNWCRDEEEEAEASS